MYPADEVHVMILYLKELGFVVDVINEILLRMVVIVDVVPFFEKSIIYKNFDEGHDCANFKAGFILMNISNDCIVTENILNIYEAQKWGHTRFVFMQKLYVKRYYNTIKFLSDIHHKDDNYGSIDYIKKIFIFDKKNYRCDAHIGESFFENLKTEYKILNLYRSHSCKAMMCGGNKIVKTTLHEKFGTINIYKNNCDGDTDKYLQVYYSYIY